MNTAQAASSFISFPHLYTTISIFFLNVLTLTYPYVYYLQLHVLG